MFNKKELQGLDKRINELASAFYNLDKKLNKRNERMNMMYKIMRKNEKLLKLLLKHFNLETITIIEQTKTSKVERKLRKKKK